LKKTLFLLFAILIYFVILSPELLAQSSNNEERIIGTWVDENDGSIWIFNANGTGTMDGDIFKYGIAQNKIGMVINSESFVFDYTLSSNGNILLITLAMGRGYFLRRRI